MIEIKEEKIEELRCDLYNSMQCLWEDDLVGTVDCIAWTDLEDILKKYIPNFKLTKEYKGQYVK